MQKRKDRGQGQCAPSFYVSARRSADVLPCGTAAKLEQHNADTGWVTLITPEGRAEIYLNFTGRQVIFHKLGIRA